MYKYRSTMLKEIGESKFLILNQVLKTDNHPKFKNIYPQCAKLYVHQDVYDNLMKVAKFAYDNYNYQLCILDAYRPLRYQKRLLSVDNDDVNSNNNNNEYVSAENIAYHCRGIAVDVAFYKDGKMLNYPPLSHDKSAHHNTYNDLSEEQIKNRELLKSIMLDNNFELYEYEWWHYNLINWQHYPILDVDFDEIK